MEHYHTYPIVLVLFPMLIPLSSRVIFPIIYIFSRPISLSVFLRHLFESIVSENRAKEIISMMPINEGEGKERRK